MEDSNKIRERLSNMSRWTIDDFIFYAPILDGIFVFNVEFDPLQPEIGWAIFQQKLQDAKDEFAATGEVAAFKAVAKITDEIRNQQQIRDN